MFRYSATLLLAVGLSAPLLTADDHDKRYYDKSHKDYHEWNANEERSYGVYLGERHIQVHAFTKAPAREQQDYWKWRHEHPDQK